MEAGGGAQSAAAGAAIADAADDARWASGPARGLARRSATPGIPALEARNHDQCDPDDGDKQNYDFHFVFPHSAS